MGFRSFLINVLKRYVALVSAERWSSTEDKEYLAADLYAPRAYILTNYIAMDIQKFKRDGWTYEFWFGQPQAVSRIDLDGEWAMMGIIIRGFKNEK